MDYDSFRHAADSLGLLYLMTLFICVVAYAYRPGGQKATNDAANIPFRDDDDRQGRIEK